MQQSHGLFPIAKLLVSNAVVGVEYSLLNQTLPHVREPDLKRDVQNLESFLSLKHGVPKLPIYRSYEMTSRLRSVHIFRMNRDVD